MSLILFTFSRFWELSSFLRNCAFLVVTVW